MFLEMWKRRAAVIRWEWDLQNVEQDEEPRPEFEANVTTYRVNPVTRQREPYLTAWNRCLRFTATGSAVMFMVRTARRRATPPASLTDASDTLSRSFRLQVVVVCCAVLGTIIYRVSLVTVFHGGGGHFLKHHAKIFTSITAACINLVIILILTRVSSRSAPSSNLSHDNFFFILPSLWKSIRAFLSQFYHQLALWLTNLENPRTQTEYEDNFTFKIFVFEFMNFYSSLIYIAFFKASAHLCGFLCAFES